MKFTTLIQNADIFTAPKNFDQLLRVSEKSVLYSFNFEFDIANASSRKVRRLDLKFSTEKPEKDFNPIVLSRRNSINSFFEQYMSSRFLDLVLSQNKEDLDIKVRNDKKFFHKSQVSFSARENPSIYRLLNRRLDRKSIVAALPPVRTYSLQRAGKLTNSPKRVPVMGGQKRGRRTRKSSKTSSLRSILKFGAHSSEAYRSSKTPVFGRRVAGAFRSKKTSKSSGAGSRGKSLRNSRVGENLRSRSLGNFAFSRNVFSTNSLPPSSLVQSYRFVRTPKRKISKKVSIPRSVLKKVGRFFVTVNAVDDRGITIQTEFLEINHAKNMITFTKPLLAPDIRSTTTRQPGRNIVKITQKDERATGFTLLKRSIGNSDFDISRPYEVIGRFPLKFGEGTRTVRDKTNNAKTVIYRVIPYLGRSSLTSTFSMLVVKGLDRVIHKRNTRLNNASIFAENEISSVRIEISHILDDPVALQLVRRDLTKHHKVYSNVKEGFMKIRNANNGATYEFTDTTTKNNHIYEYGCFMIFSNGERVFTNDTSIVERRPRNPKSATIIISNFSVDEEERNVTFDVESEISKQTPDELQDLLESQGLSSIFNDVLNANRDDLKGLIAHEIKRIDKKSGAEEYFGVLTGKTFNDKNQGKIMGVSPIEEGHTYRYQISTLLRKPQQLVPGYTQVKDGPNGKFLVSPAKYFNPYTLRTGIGVEGGNPASVATSPLALGSLDNFLEIDVNFPIINPEVTSIQAQRYTRNFVKIDWEISGDPNKIDYFVLVESQFGVQKIVDLIHANTDNNSFQYLHEVDPENPGEFSYQVIPKLINGDDGLAATSPSLVIQ
tara:strand:- start:25811 stop:28300 length:2490 start_codon:yes stop_codon:yes gene_type:complete